MAGYTSCVSVARCSTRCICRWLRGDVLGVVAHYPRTPTAGVDPVWWLPNAWRMGDAVVPPSRTIWSEGASTGAWRYDAGRTPQHARGCALPRRDAAYRT